MLRTIPMSAAAVLLAGSAAGQKVFHTVDEALRLAFGEEAVVARTTEVLAEAEQARIEELAGVQAKRGIVFPYVARRDGEVVGTAYFDTHRVRTLRETLMVMIGADGRVSKVVVCAFAEPLDYVPRDSFYAQFEGRALDDELRLRHGIDGVTGATLTSRATTDAARRVLATHRVLAERRVEEDGQEERQERGETGGEGRGESGEPPGTRESGRGEPPPAPKPDGRKPPRGRSAVRDDEAPR